jgi:protein TonB
MSTPASLPPRRPPNLAAWKPSARSLLWVLLAFAVGLALFAWAVSGGRQGDLFRADQAPPTSASRDYAPLPAPLPAGDAHGNASGLGEQVEADKPGAQRPYVVEAPRPPPAPAPTAASAPAAPRPAPSSATTLPMPIAGQTPAPRYPTRALRRGESGTVRVRVEVGPDGRPAQVTVAQASGSRDLDRAAVDAVRRWRFQPARRNGEPVTGTVIVPISFHPD